MASDTGVSDDAIYEDQASGQREDRPGLAAFLKAARQRDVIVVWRLDRLGRNLRHLVNLVQDLNDRDIGIRVLAGQGASIDTTTASGKLVFALFAALAEIRIIGHRSGDPVSSGRTGMGGRFAPESVAGFVRNTHPLRGLIRNRIKRGPKTPLDPDIY